MAGGAVAAVAAVVCDKRTASRDAAIDVSVAAFTVASTRALMASGSMVKSVEGSRWKKVSGVAVGDGVGVLVARFRILACGDGNLNVEGSCRVDRVEGRLLSDADSSAASESTGFGVGASSDACDEVVGLYDHQLDMGKKQEETRQVVQRSV